MLTKSLVNQKLERLINIMLTDGVQPGDLSNNIFFDSYKQISYVKKDDTIIGEIVFTEEEKNVDIKMRYIYTLDKKIIRIEEEIDNNITLQWDRNIIETELVTDIVELLKGKYTEAQMKKFVSTLPEYLKEKVKNSYYAVA